ncbi:putative quinol monooxygenase [Parasphingopyxis lamellibrachiae]|uniref:Quinol monooxygenase YgiN n=1 Tax=Parasphingopyxis lamellibrachiae TaxID=680125 RepID=A0A3D9FI97_9SPHN|nr:antibiotic biosynthesis monooxygenase [Parasphingopyxis lamellibrachiae]RED17348.1 quinol monooxygenase YgiN [Parasphingopyxis lamellibrachiae]
MIAIIATLTAKEGSAQKVEDALAAAAPAVRSDAEPDCHYYQPTRVAGEPNVFKVFEVYEDKAALAAHSATAHFAPLKELFATELSVPPVIDILDVFG